MFFSGEKEYWKWLETNNQTQENIIDKRFNLKEIVSLTRESAQNSVDAFFFNTKDKDANNAVINYKFESSNSDLSKYFSGLVEARDVLDDSGLWGSLYSKKFDFNNCTWLMLQDSNTKGLEGPLDSRKSDFWSFVLNWGRSNKVHQERANSGSKGVGRITFPLFSEMRCIFALTKRPDGEHLVGYAMLNTHDDEKKKKFYDSAALFVKSAKEGGIWTLHDELIPKFKKDFKIPEIEYRGKSSFGTTIIIPFPKIDEDKNLDDYYDQIKASLIETYGPLILRDQFAPVINNEEVTHENLPRITSQIKHLFSIPELQESGEDYMDFLSDAIVENEAEEYEAEITLKKDTKLDVKDESLITPEERYIINNALENNEVVNIKINFPIVINGKNHDTFVEACFRKPKNDAKGFEGYYRNGMLMISQEKRLDKRYQAALLCRESNIARYLNIFEDEGHTKWIAGQQQKADAESKGYDKRYYIRPLRLCQSILLDLTKVFNEKKQEVNYKTLANFFTLPEKKKINSDITPKDEIKKKVNKFLVQQRKAGFRIHARDDVKTPNKISIRFNAKHHPYQKKPAVNADDVIFNDSSFQAENCSYNIVNDVTESGKLLGKVIYIEDIEKDFSFELKDFESNYEITYKVEAEE